MKKAAVVLTVLALAGPVLAQSRATIQGAGATFPNPIYQKWAAAYNKLTGVKINYNSIGSGGGISQIKAGTVDFGASDAPLEPGELKSAALVQFPMVIGGVVPVVRIEGIKAGQLKLTGEVMASIFLGSVKKWNDDRIRKLNPGLNLPNRAIVVVSRADSSGTTWIFTTYLSRLSDEFKQKVGADKAAKFPVGVAAKGNEGVAAYVNRLNGSIGYVEYAYALQNRMAHVQLRNAAGRFVEPTMETFQAAAANADWQGTEGFYVVLTNQPGEDSWPITGASFILVPTKMKEFGKAQTMLRFFDWAYQHGDEMAVDLHYVPMPKSVVRLVEARWAADVTADGKRVWPIEDATGADGR